MKQTSRSFRFVVSLLALGLGLSAAAAHAADEPKEEAPYDLGDLPEGFEIEWPAAPEISRETTVHSIEMFNKAAATPKTRIFVDRDLGHGVITANDIEVQMTDKGSLAGLRIERSVKRVALIGGEYTNTIEISYPATFNGGRVDKEEWMAEDITIDGVNVTAPNTTFFLRGKRIALLHSSAHAGDYALFSDTGSKLQNENVIVADNDLVSEGHQATVRLISDRESVTVDNRITSMMAANGTKHNYRVHGQTDKAFAARNVLVNAGVMLSTMPGDHANHIWFENNTFHHQTPDLFNPSTTMIDELTVQDNVAFTNVWKCFYCRGALPSGWAFDDNEVKPYEAPPSL